MKLMNYALSALAYAGLALVIVPAIMVFLSVIDIQTSKKLMTIGTVMWFVIFGFKQYGLKK